MRTLKPFIYLFDKAIREHTAAFIYPVRTSEERENNAKWIVNHYTNRFLEEETKFRDIYCLGLYHGQIPRFLEFNSGEYSLFTSIRDKVISNYALGVSERELFEQSSHEPIQRPIMLNRMHNCARASHEIIIRSKQTLKMQINDSEFIQHLILP